VSVDNLFLVSVIEADTICEIQKIEHFFCAGQYQPTQKIETFVSAAYVSRHKKLIFFKKKTPESRCSPMMPRSEHAVINLPLVNVAGGHHEAPAVEEADVVR
jgi:hypothetical protein